MTASSPLHIVELVLVVLEELDGVEPCGPAALNLLQRGRTALASSQPALAIDMGERLRRLADEKILSYPYKDVPTCWRRLYTDSSILEAAGRLSLASIVDEEKGADEALKGIERLDMALVVAGAPGQGREDIVHRLIVELQLYCAHQAEVTRPRKKARLEEVAEPAVERPIPRFSSPPDVDTYLRDLLASPFIITSGAADWPALIERAWSSPSYLLDVAGPGRVVPVEVGGTYTQATWSQRIMSFSTFLRCIGLAPATEQDKEDDLLYLAQHDLFRQLPQLQNDILIPDYLYSVPPAPKEAPNYAPPDTETGYILNAWLGPAGTTSPAHTDPYYNCFAQVVGRKWIWVAPPSCSAAMYPYGASPSDDEIGGEAEESGSSSYMTNTSRVDVAALWTPELAKRFPDFESVRGKAMQAVLEPGDLLIMPPGWWHSLKSLSVSFSVSMWCD